MGVGDAGHRELEQGADLRGLPAAVKRFDQVVTADAGRDGSAGDTRCVEPPVDGRWRATQPRGDGRRRPARQVRVDGISAAGSWPATGWGADRRQRRPASGAWPGLSPRSGRPAPADSAAITLEMRELRVCRHYPMPRRPGPARHSPAISRLHQAGTAADLASDLRRGMSTLDIQPADVVVTDVVQPVSCVCLTLGHLV
jgi:hypothetical protein